LSLERFKGYLRDKSYPSGENKSISIICTKE